MSDELLKLRAEIDRLDGEILERLAARARCAQRVGEVRVHRVLQQIERGLQGLRRADVTRRDGRFEADEAAGVVGGGAKRCAVFAPAKRAGGYGACFRV